MCCQSQTDLSVNSAARSLTTEPRIPPLSPNRQQSHSQHVCLLGDGLCLGSWVEGWDDGTGKKEEVKDEGVVRCVPPE